MKNDEWMKTEKNNDINVIYGERANEEETKRRLEKALRNEE